ncbi:ribosome modulation factor [Methylobacterium sp. P31]
MILQAIAEGAHARATDRSKDSCPCPAGTPEQKALLKGYDGTPTEVALDSLIANA